MSSAVASAEALSGVEDATKVVAIRFDAIDDTADTAAGFYEHHGFRAVPGTMRLTLKFSDVAAALAD